MNFEIRAATNDDLNGIIQIIDNHYKKYNDFVNLNFYDKDLNDLDKNYFHKNGFFWVACHESKIIAFIAFIPKDDNICEVKRVYTDPLFHGTEISYALMKNLICFIKTKNYKKIILWSDTRYTKSHLFFIKNGFKKIKTQEFFDADNAYRAILFEKNLYNEDN